MKISRARLCSTKELQTLHTINKIIDLLRENFRTLLSLEQVITIGHRNFVIWHLAIFTLVPREKEVLFYVNYTALIQELKVGTSVTIEDKRQQICNLVIENFMVTIWARNGWCYFSLTNGIPSSLYSNEYWINYLKNSIFLWIFK